MTNPLAKCFEADFALCIKTGAYGDSAPRRLAQIASDRGELESELVFNDQLLTRGHCNAKFVAEILRGLGGKADE